MKLALSVSVLSLLATPAFALPPGLPIDACPVQPAPDETYRPTYIPDGGGVTVTIDAFEATRQAPTTCNIVVDARGPDDNSLPPPAPDTFDAYSADYRGFVAPDKSATLSVTENGTTRQVSFGASEDGYDGYMLHTYVSPDSAGQLRSDAVLTVTGDDDDLGAAVDTVDYLYLGSTTLESQQDSLEQLAGQGTALITHLGATGGLVLGNDQPYDRDTQVSLLGAVGSHTVGLSGHLNFGDGLSLDGGAALFDQSVGGASSSGLLFGGKLGYQQTENGGPVRFLGSIGLLAAPDMDLRFSRSYEIATLDGPSTVSGLSEGRGSMVGAWLEGGVLVAPAPDNEIVFTASYARNWLGFDDLAEEQTDANPFAFSSDGASTYDVIKAKAAWTTQITPALDLTVHGAVGQVFAGDFSGDVALVGPLTVGGQDETFAEYGTAVGWEVTDAAAVSLFALGSTGSSTGTHFQVGSAVSMKF